ncbi:unnamed protein product, partial [Allacma fusca]
MSVYPFSKDIVRFCQNSKLMFYSDVNYAGTPSQNLAGKTCKALKADSFKSVRFYDVLSLGYTGKSAWTLFEGKNFDDCCCR